MACEWAALGLDYVIVYKRTDDWEKDWLSEKGPYSDLQFEVLITYARSISSDREKSITLSAISTELAQQGNPTVAEQVSLEIPLTFYKFDCWKDIAKNSYEKDSWSGAIHQVDQFQNVEVKTLYLKGLADATTSSDCNKELILDAARFYAEDIESMQKLLQKHALHEVFLNNASEDRLKRLNRTLNIQWAIDIKNSISAN